MTEKSGFEFQQGQEISLVSIAYRLAQSFRQLDVSLGKKLQGHEADIYLILVLRLVVVVLYLHSHMQLDGVVLN
jgi:hypothetical protein